MAESSTHTDGIIGHFDIGKRGKTDLVLWDNATQLVLLEAKISSRLSSGVKNVKYFDQATRNVACIAEILSRANRLPSDMSHVGFFVLAPQFQVERGVFDSQMSRDGLMQKVKLRIKEYEGIRDYTDWYNRWFEPTFERIIIGTLSWEEILETIEGYDQGAGSSLKQFYKQCLAFNHKAMLA